VAVGSERPVLAEEIERVVTPVVAAHRLILVDVDLRGGGRRSVLRVFVDKPGGTGVDDCRRLSEELGDVLDASDLLAGSYDLEVSSPGLDRELRKERELRWAIGKPVRAWLREPHDGRREVAGRLVEVDETSLTLEEAAGRCQVPRDLLTKVRLELEPRRSARVGGSRG
jgi:ribosome maturation factor RimP